MSYHICGINNFSINTFNLLKKKNCKVTISDKRDKKNFLNKFKISKKDLKDFYFSGHPQEKMNNAKKIIVTPGFIKTEKDYSSYIKNKKYISEIDLFYNLSEWKKSRILFVTGSKGKTTLCKKIYYILKKKNLFSNVYYMDRKKYTFSNLPDPKKNSFLIAETDYQTLLISKKIKAKYRISAHFSYFENKAFDSKKLYLKAKRKIAKDLKNKDILILDHTSSKNFQLKNKSVFSIKKYSIVKKNKLISNSIISQIEKDYNAKN